MSQGPASTTNPWTTKVYPREGRFAGFDRLINFTDAVYAIALTLAALEIGVPEIAGDHDGPAVLWEATVSKGPQLAAFAVAFVWVAVYWVANHKFTATLKAVSRRYTLVTLLYLAFVALLPLPAEMLGEYWGNPIAVSVFAVFVACVSAIEVLLWQVAYADDLFLIRPSRQYTRQQMLGSCTPVVIFLLSIPLAFVSTALAILFWFVASVATGFVLSRTLTAPPPQPVQAA